MSHKGWIGVDLDGTLAEYHGWDNGKIGAPIPKMADRVKRWIAAEVEVRILTARVSGPLLDAQPMEFAIKDWCAEHLGCWLPVTCRKDYAMIELWDDRAIQVVPNTGDRVDGED